MDKKPLVVISILAVFFCLFLFVILRKPASHNQSAITAVPADAAMVLRANGMMDLCNSIKASNYWQNLPENSIKKNFEKFLASADTLAGDFSDIDKIINDSLLYVSLHQNADKSLGVLFYLPFGTSGNKEIVAARIYLFLSGQGFKLIKYDPADTRKTNIQITGDAHLYWFFEKGLLVLGNNIRNLSDAYIQMNNKKNLLSDTSFTKVFSTTGKKVAGNLFINMQKISALLAPLIKPEYYESFNKALYSRGWVALDLNIERTYISLHGFSVLDASKQIWAKAFKNELPSENISNKLLPASTVFYSAYSFTDPYNYKLAFSSSSRNNTILSDKLKRIRQAGAGNLDDKLFNILAGSAGMIVCQKKGAEQNIYFLIKTRGNMEALDYINIFRKNKSHGSNYRMNKNGSVSDTVFDKITFQKLPASNLPAVLFGEAASPGNYSYICNYREYLILGSSEESLRNYLTEIMQNKNLGGDTLYQAVMSDLFSSKSNISMYLNIPSSWSFFKSCFNPELSDKVGSYLLNIKSGSVMGIQVSGNGQFFYNNLFLYSEAREYNGPEPIWSINTDTSLDAPPILLSGATENKNMYLLQDRNTTIYLISSNGNILWKQKLGEKILGSACLIDYYKNNKQQILFNTAEKLYLIDKKGKILKGFPVKFKSPATNGIAVNDFDGNRNYRYYLAFENKLFTPLSKEGKKVDGWKFSKTAGKVAQMAQLLSFKNKDYILFNDSSTIYLLNRKGEQRLKLKNGIHLSAMNSVAIDKKPDFFRFVLTDTCGKVFIVYPDGHSENKDFGRYSPNHYFDYEDIDGNGIKDYIFTDGTAINAFNQEGKNILKKQFSDSISQRPLIVRSKNDKTGIFISLQSAGKVVMLDNSGNIVKGFPINGNFPMKVISLGDDNYSFALFTGIGTKLYFYYIR